MYNARIRTGGSIKSYPSSGWLGRDLSLQLLLLQLLKQGQAAWPCAVARAGAHGAVETCQGVFCGTKRIRIVKHNCHEEWIIEGSLEVKLPTIWTVEKQR